MGGSGWIEDMRIEIMEGKDEMEEIEKEMIEKREEGIEKKIDEKGRKLSDMEMDEIVILKEGKKVIEDMVGNDWILREEKGLKGVFDRRS